MRTPLVLSRPLSELAGVEVYLKLETLQPTGSFKIRGAASKILNLAPADRARGVVAASTGNHGRAVSHVAAALRIPATICISSQVPHGKARALAELGAKVETAGDSQSTALSRAHEIAKESGAVFVHPFDDPDVIAGQGTIGLEIAAELPRLASVLVPLSGGGLLSGIASALAGRAPGVATIGVSMQRGAAMAASIAAGHPVDCPEEETLADSLRGGIGSDNRHSFRIVASSIESVTLVEEAAIWSAMRFLFDQHRVVAEGGAAVGVAALLAGELELSAGPAVVVVSGGNAEPEQVSALAARAELAPELTE